MLNCIAYVYTMSVHRVYIACIALVMLCASNAWHAHAEQFADNDYIGMWVECTHSIIEYTQYIHTI